VRAQKDTKVKQSRELQRGKQAKLGSGFQGRGSVLTARILSKHCGTRNCSNRFLVFQWQECIQILFYSVVIGHSELTQFPGSTANRLRAKLSMQYAGCFITMDRKVVFGICFDLVLLV
jgi:hypothetical protein